jgi:hypothetical protein
MGYTQLNKNVKTRDWMPIWLMNEILFSKYFQSDQLMYKKG